MDQIQIDFFSTFENFILQEKAMETKNVWGEGNSSLKYIFVRL